jgi:hypothetical protein
LDISTALLAYLRHLSPDPAQAAQLATRLARLSQDIAVWVPSWQSISIVLAAQPHDIDISVLAPGIDARAAVLASLAVQVSDRHEGALLIVRAGQPGAFLLLGDELTAGFNASHPITLDNHLSPPPTLQEQAAVLADLDAVNQAIGALLEQGFPPPDARRELQRRATAAASSVPAAAHRLLNSLPTPPDPDHVDTG